MRIHFVLFSLLGLSHYAFSQTDSSLFDAAFTAHAHKEVNELIYNGREHVGYPSSVKGNPYYLTTDWQNGSIVFQGVPFTDVPLKYDVLADEIILGHPNGFSRVTLFTPRVQSFTLGNRVFVNLPGDGAGFKGGIHEQLAQGSLLLYAKRSKRIEKAVLLEGVEQNLVDVNKYYVFKEGQYYLIKKTNALLELMGDKKKEVTAWFHSQGSALKADPETAFIQIVAYYNQLSQ